jgi:hypothetical protein
VQAIERGAQVLERSLIEQLLDTSVAVIRLLVI